MTNKGFKKPSLARILFEDTAEEIEAELRGGGKKGAKKTAKARASGNAMRDSAFGDDKFTDPEKIKSYQPTDKEKDQAWYKRYGMTKRQYILARKEGQGKLTDEDKERLGTGLRGAIEAGAVATVDFLNQPENKNAAAKEFLGTGLSDGSATDDVVPVTEVAVAANNLMPTQGFIDFSKSVSYPLSNFDSFEEALAGGPTTPGDRLTIAKNHAGGDQEFLILDGHHRWSGIAICNPDCKINVRLIKFDEAASDLKNPSQLLAKAHVAVHASTPAGAKLPSKGGSAALDIMGKSAQKMLELFDKSCGKQMDGNVLTNDNWIKAFMGSETVKSAFDITDEEPLQVSECTGEGLKCPVRNKIFTKLAANWEAGKYAQADGTPAQRENMPQLDHELVGGDQGFETMRNRLKAGEIQINPTNENKLTEAVVLNRWAQLAGIKEQ